MRKIALICATSICIAMLVAVLVSDLLLRPDNPQLAEEWDTIGSLTVSLTGVMILFAFIDD